MATIEDVLDQVDGLRRDAADRVAAQFASVTELAAASADQLTAIKGIGQVMADRILAAAKGARTAASTSTSSTASRHKDAKRLVGDAVERVSGTARKVVEPARKVVEPAKKVVDRAGGEARKVVDRAGGEARKVVDRAGGEAKKVVDKVTRRGK